MTIVLPGGNTDGLISGYSSMYVYSTAHGGTYDVVGDTPVVEDPNDVVDDTLVVTVVVGT
jgi:hypothetical protein